MFAFVTSEQFDQLDDKDRDRLEALAKLDQFEAGQQILSAGEPGEFLYLIANGGVDLRVPRGGEDVTLVSLHTGQIFGELEAFTDLPAGLRHVARTGTIVRAVPKDPLKQELRAHRNLATSLLSVYCRSISEKIRAASEVAARYPPAPRPAGEEREPYLDEGEVAWLRLLGQEIRFPADTAVVSEGDATRAFYIIENGLVEVKKRVAGGDLRSLARLGPRDLFGFMAFIDGSPRSASVFTADPTVLTKIEPDALDRAMKLNFTVAFKFLGTLCTVLARTFRDTAKQVIG